MSKKNIKVIVNGCITTEMKREFNKKLAIALVAQYTKEGALMILNSIKEDFEREGRA